MKELPILFTAPMPHAILADQTTQTRRVVKQELRQLGDGDWYAFDHKGINYRVNARHTTVGGWAHLLQFCPYGQPGDRLWVRETFYAFGRWETRFSEKKGRDEWHFVDLTHECDRIYQFSDPTPDARRQRASATPAWWMRPSIHMPRAASRITLEVTGLRVERLSDCSVRDAIAEGAEPVPPDPVISQVCPEDCLAGYRKLWEQINGAGSWAANPWVWVVEFRRVES